MGLWVHNIRMRLEIGDFGLMILGGFPIEIKTEIRYLNIKQQIISVLISIDNRPICFGLQYLSLKSRKLV